MDHPTLDPATIPVQPEQTRPAEQAEIREGTGTNTVLFTGILYQLALKPEVNMMVLMPQMALSVVTAVVFTLTQMPVWELPTVLRFSQ